MQLIIIGGNARLIQKVLANTFFVSQFKRVIIYTKNKYRGKMLPDMEILLAEDPESLKSRLLEDVKNGPRVVILYVSALTKRAISPQGLEKMDPKFSFFLQDLAVAQEAIHKLVLLGSTEALPLLPGGDRYIVNKKHEYRHFLRLHRLYHDPKSCYVALPPLDTSNHWLGRHFAKSRHSCANAVIKATNTQASLMAPRGLFFWIARITSAGIKKENF